MISGDDEGSEEATKIANFIIELFKSEAIVSFEYVHTS